MLFSDLRIKDQFFFLKDILDPKGVRVCEKKSFSQYDAYKKGAILFSGTATCEAVVRVRS